MQELQNENIILKNQLQYVKAIPEIIGQSLAMQKLTTMIHKVASTDATVLVAW